MVEQQVNGEGGGEAMTVLDKADTTIVLRVKNAGVSDGLSVGIATEEDTSDDVESFEGLD